MNTPPDTKKDDILPAKKKKPSMLEEVQSLRMKNRHIISTFNWALSIIVVSAVIGILVAVFIVNRASGSVKMTQALSYEQQLTRNTLVAEGMATRIVVNNAVTELKGVLKKASEENVAAQVASANSVNKTLEAEGMKNEVALTKLQNATVDGLTGATAQMKENGEASKANADKLEAMLTETATKQTEIARLQAELTVLKVNPTRLAEAPVAQTDNLSLAKTAGKAPVAKSRELKQSAPIETSEWKNVPAGTVSDTYSCDAVRQRKIEVQEDIDGLVVLSYRGWPRRLIGQYSVGDTVPIAHGATSVAFTHPTKSFNIKVN
jgi:hypothetical protein